MRGWGPQKNICGGPVISSYATAATAVVAVSALHLLGFSDYLQYIIRHVFF